MPHPVNRPLIHDQIRDLRREILLINFVFCFFNALSLVLLCVIWRKLTVDRQTSNIQYIELLKAFAALAVPYLAAIAGGLYFGRLRKVNALRSLLYKEELHDEELKLCYDK